MRLRPSVHLLVSTLISQSLKYLQIFQKIFSTSFEQLSLSLDLSLFFSKKFGRIVIRSDLLFRKPYQFISPRDIIMRTMKEIETKSTEVLLMRGYVAGSNPMVIRTKTFVSFSISSTIRSPNSFVMKIATAFSTETGGRQNQKLSDFFLHSD